MARTLRQQVKANLEAAWRTNSEAIAGYNAALSQDSDNPYGSYSLDGEHVDRDKWRAGIAKIIAGLIKDNHELELLITPRIGMKWLGKPKSAQTDYPDRD